MHTQMYLKAKEESQMMKGSGSACTHYLHHKEIIISEITKQLIKNIMDICVQTHKILNHPA